MLTKYKADLRCQNITVTNIIGTGDRASHPVVIVQLESEMFLVTSKNKQKASHHKPVQIISVTDKKYHDVSLPLASLSADNCGINRSNYK